MGVAGAVEREVKLAGWPGLVLPDLAYALPGVGVMVLGPLRLDATYWDTADLRLARSGASLRYRSEMMMGVEGATTEPKPPWTLKLPTLSNGPGLARRELTFVGRQRRVPPEASAIALGITRGAPLVAVARLRTDRARLLFTDADGTSLAELDDDEVSVLIAGPGGRGRRVASRFRELEVELVDGADPTVLDAITRVLRSLGAGPPDPTPKVVRALGPRAQDAADVVVPRVDRNAAVAEAISAAVATSVAALIHHDAGVRLDDDPEDVHKARVATRRLRSDLRTFRAFLDPEWAGSLREELRWAAGLLGGVRDADVLIERLKAEARRLDAADHGAAESLLLGLDHRRNDARTKLLTGMESSRYTDLLDRLVVAARIPVLAVEAGPTASARDVLPTAVLRPWRHLASAVAAAGDEPSEDQLHEIRIRAKRCRYAAEAVAPVVGKQAHRLAAAVADVQEVLGDFHDAVVAAAWLREHGRTVTANEAMVAGQLVAVEDRIAARSRRMWLKSWKRASARNLRTWIPGI
ncbi:MAG: CYTH and CHAD domain-containing protein [Acidimicrobiales bacterium]